MSGFRNPSHARLASRVVLWGLAFTPALLMLAWLWPLRVSAPYYDSWNFVMNYRDWCGGHFGWRDWLVPHNQHPALIGRAVYFMVLQWARGNVALLPLLSWIFSLAIALSVLGLSRPLWRVHPVRGACLMFLANLSIFTATQGQTWVWDFMFQNFIPGMCLALGLLLLNAPEPRAWRFAVALLLGVMAAFSFGTGFVVGFLLLPAVWMALLKKSSQARWLATICWAALFAGVTWLAFAFSRGGNFEGNNLHDLLERPLDIARYILVLLGGTLGRGTAVEPEDFCSGWGALLVLVVLLSLWALLRCRDAAVRRACWPWLAFVLWAMLNVAAICMGRFRDSFQTALAPRYGTFTLFMPLGVLLLWAAVAQSTETGVMGRWMRKLSVPAAMILLGMQCLSWDSGGQTLEINSRIMSAARAALYFNKVLPPLKELPWTYQDGSRDAELARYLQSRGKLPGMKFAADALLSSLHPASPISERWAHWDLARLSGGRVEMRGTCGLSRDRQSTPDLILITAQTTAQPETVVAMVPVILPDDFLESGNRRRESPGHYFGWNWPVVSEKLPKGQATLRAYAFDGDTFRTRPIQGEASLVIDSSGGLH